VTSTIFGSTVGYPSDSLASCLFFSNRRVILFCWLRDSVCSIISPRTACKRRQKRPREIALWIRVNRREIQYATYALKALAWRLYG